MDEANPAVGPVLVGQFGEAFAVGGGVDDSAAPSPAAGDQSRQQSSEEDGEGDNDDQPDDDEDDDDDSDSSAMDADVFEKQQEDQRRREEIAEIEDHIKREESRLTTTQNAILQKKIGKSILTLRHELAVKKGFSGNEEDYGDQDGD